MNKYRLDWISGAKFVAIAAVVIVHCNGLMYTNNYIAMATSFSVTLFVLLSGMGTFISYDRNPSRTFMQSMIKILPLIKSYIIATIILYIIYEREFVLSRLLKHIVSFDMEGTFYFIFFFLQLKVLSPMMIKWYQYCDRSEQRYILHVASLISVLILSSLFIKYTYTLPLYGGGKFLLGGTYFFVYYLGIVIGSIYKIQLNQKNQIVLFGVSSILWIIWSVGIATYKLPFDIWLRPFLGYGDNPPSFNYIVFALITLAVCYSSFSLICSMKYKLSEYLMRIVVFLGDNTLEIFLYHLSIRNIFIDLLPSLSHNTLMLRLILFPAMIVLAPVLKLVINRIIYKTLK